LKRHLFGFQDVKATKHFALSFFDTVQNDRIGDHAILLQGARGTSAFSITASLAGGNRGSAGAWPSKCGHMDTDWAQARDFCTSIAFIWLGDAE
jgi:hypothetical protein